MINRIRSLGVLAVLAAAPLSAQMKLGVMAGGVSSKLSISGDLQGTELKSLTGFAAGLSMVAPSNGPITWAPEVFYVVKGSKLTDGDISGQYKIAYIEVPLLLRAKVGGNSSMQPFVTAGPQISFKASCKVSVTDGTITVKNECDDALETEGRATFKSTDIGAVVGAGIQSGRLTVTARYDMGLTNINKLVGDDSKVKNKSLMLLVGFGF